MKKIYSIAFYCVLLFLPGINTALAATTTTLQPQQVMPVTVDSSTVVKQEALININSADKETLIKIKGISKKKAQAIINYRNQNGLFKSLEDLLKVNCRGVHKKWLEKVSEFLTV